MTPPDAKPASEATWPQLARFLVGVYAVLYLVFRAPHFWGLASLPSTALQPVGILSSLAAPLPGWLIPALHLLALFLSLAFALGVAFRWSGPSFSLVLLVLLTYRHSWGMIFHTDNLMWLHVAAISCAPSAGGNGGGGRSDRWLAPTIRALTVSTYIIAGVAKLRLAGWDWADGTLLRQLIAHDALRKLQLGSVYSPLGAWLVQFESVFFPLSAFSLGVELLSPLALLGRRWGYVWSVGAFAFHLGVLALMAIVFPYPLSGIAFIGFLPLVQVRALQRAHQVIDQKCSFLINRYGTTFNPLP